MDSCLTCLPGPTPRMAEIPGLSNVGWVGASQLHSAYEEGSISIDKGIQLVLHLANCICMENAKMEEVVTTEINGRKSLWFHMYG